MDDSVKAQLADCIALWNSTEKVIKEAELINGALVQPSINELRYAGRWIVLALGAIIKNDVWIDKLTTVEKALSYACLCCMQAKHDAIDSVVLFLHEKIDALNERYTAHTIALYVKDYEDFLLEMEEVDRAIILSRGERENRLDLYERVVTKHLPKLMDFLKRIRLAEIHINKAIEDEVAAQRSEHEKHEELVSHLTGLLEGSTAESRRNGRYFRISLVFNAVLLILAVVPFLLTPKKEAPPTPNQHISAHSSANTPPTGEKPGGAQQPAKSNGTSPH